MASADARYYLWGRRAGRPRRRLLGRAELSGGVEETLAAGTVYQAGGRFVMDVQGLLWRVELAWGWGPGTSGSDEFSGWTLGAEISFAFSSLSTRTVGRIELRLAPGQS